jgi:hypothetical protein
MSKRLRKLYHWFRDGFGSTVVASSWVLLWLLWPIRPPVAPSEGPGRAARVSYVRMSAGDMRFRVMPDQFARAQLAGLGIADRIEGMMSEAPDPKLPPPDFLERTPEDAARGPRGNADLLAERAGAMPSRYRYDRGGAPVFGSAEPATSGVHVALSPVLKASGFELPSPAGLPGEGRKAWMVRAYIDVHPRGWVEHVILETPCDDADVNATIIRYLQKGSATATERRRSGRVTVAFVP